MIDSKNILGISATHVSKDSHDVALHPETFVRFQSLRALASKEGFDIRIASGYRGFERQSIIWNAKARGERPTLDDAEKTVDMSSISPAERVFAILRWSALPGGSRHHWGTDFDIYDAAALADGQTLSLTIDETAEGGVFYDMYKWLDHHLTGTSDFFRPYAKDLGGVAPEPWHLSDRVLSEKYANQLNKDILRRQIEAHDIELKHEVLRHFDTIYEQYIVNVCEP